MDELKEMILQLGKQLNERMDQGFKSVNERIDRLESKIDHTTKTLESITEILDAHSGLYGQHIVETQIIKNKLGNESKKSDFQVTFDDHTRMLRDLLYDFEILKTKIND